MDADQSESLASDDVMTDDQSNANDVTTTDQSDSRELASAMETNEIESTDAAFESKCNIDNPSKSNKILGKSVSDEEISSRIDEMIDRLSNSDAHFKHQQRDEPDLMPDQKSEIARTLFNEQPVKFLSQFSKYLAHSDIPCFKYVADDPTVQTYLIELEKSSKTSNKRRVMNRRFQAMKAFTTEGEYFSEESMKHRDPLLYEQMIGQYLSAEERKPPEIDRGDHRFSTILMEFMEKCDDNEVMQGQKEKEEEQEEETDSEDEEEEVTRAEANDGNARMHAVPSTSSADVEASITDEEKTMLKEEFLHIMQERFMAGNEREFDYKTVDENDEYDPLDIRAQDEEEKYFDQMEPETASDNLDSDSDCWIRPTHRTNDDDDS